MSWMKGLFAPRANDSDLIRWAKTEYGKDWQDAYYQMKTKPGVIPTIKGVIQ